MSVDRRECRLSRPVVVTSQSGSLASMTSQQLGVGTVECPWSVRVSPGQRVALSLRYFRPETAPPPPADGAAAPTAKNTNENKMAATSNCYELATVRESGGGESRSITSCDGGGGAERGDHELFTSSSNQVVVQMVGRMMLQTLGRFIITYRGRY